jgi:XTP/dITP diphosphohydrolase
MALKLPRLVIATHNAGKLREFRALLSSVADEVISQSELGLESVEETADSFVGNALIKARHAARAFGGAALADDSGLEVDALQGAPGIYSARYAGVGATDRDNNQKLLTMLAGVPSPRRARYRAALVLLTDPDDLTPIIAEGVWEGEIAQSPQGAGGFGYDPLFVPCGSTVTVAEMAVDVKNRCSHRAQAMAALLARVSR